MLYGDWLRLQLPRRGTLSQVFYSAAWLLLLYAVRWIMGYQSKTYSLSDEVVAVIDAAKARGETPNQLLRRVLLPMETDFDEFDQRRKEIQSRIAQGARRTRPQRQKGDTKR